MQVIASQAGGSCICEYRSPQSLTRQTHGHRDSHTNKVAWGGDIPPRVNVQHTRARVGYWTWPEGPVLGSSCPLRWREEPQPQGAARWSGCASAPELCPAAADSRSSASVPLLGRLAPGTRHLKSRQSGPGFLPISPPWAPPCWAPLTYKVIGFANVIVPDCDFQSLGG